MLQFVLCNFLYKKCYSEVAKLQKSINNSIYENNKKILSIIAQPVPSEHFTKIQEKWNASHGKYLLFLPQSVEDNVFIMQALYWLKLHHSPSSFQTKAKKLQAFYLFFLSLGITQSCTRAGNGVSSANQYLHLRAAACKQRTLQGHIVRVSELSYNTYIMPAD